MYIVHYIVTLESISMLLYSDNKSVAHMRNHNLQCVITLRCTASHAHHYYMYVHVYTAYQHYVSCFLIAGGYARLVINGA